MNEAQRRRVYAVAQTAAICWAIGKYMAKVAIAIARSDLRSTHPVRRIIQFFHIGRLNGLGEARPATARVKLVGRNKQGLSGNDIHVDTGFFVVEILTGT